MWDTYRIISKIYFPNARLIVDKFHILQELSRRVSRIRIDVMKKYKSIYDDLYNELKSLRSYNQKLSPEKQELLIQADRNYYLLKKFDWILFKNIRLDPNDEKKMNHKLGQYLNLYDIYDLVLRIDKDLMEAVELKDLMVKFYRECSHDKAKQELEELVILFRTSHLKEMNGFADTLVKWKYEIINSFIVVPTHSRKMSNALIENRNKSIKLLKHSSNGYTNWPRFRNRILYSLNDDSTFTL